MAPVNLTRSAYKHGFELEEALYVMAHPVAARLVERTARGEVWVYVGHPAEGSARRVELLAEQIPPRTVEVFHLMDLTDIWRAWGVLMNPCGAALGLAGDPPRCRTRPDTTSIGPVLRLAAHPASPMLAFPHGFIDTPLWTEEP